LQDSFFDILSLLCLTLEDLLVRALSSLDYLGNQLRLLLRRESGIGGDYLDSLNGLGWDGRQDGLMGAGGGQYGAS